MNMNAVAYGPSFGPARSWYGRALWAVVGVQLVAVTGCATVREEEVRFSNGPVTLAGTLVLPAGRGPHPAVVLVHGDGPETRDGYRFFARRFAERGIAALIYDKRGEGGSTGDWRQSRFHDLAADATAGIEMLHARTDIRRDRTGVWGGSQGGWIAPLAAAESDDIAFVIVKAGPMVGPAELATYKSVERVRRAGYSEDVQQRVRALMELQFSILRSGRGWDRLDSAVATVRAEPWFRHVAVMRHSSWQSSWMGYGVDIDFDIVAVLERLDVPALFIFGEADPETPVPESVEVLDRMKRELGKDFTTVVFPGADHQIELPRTSPRRPRYAPGYPDVMLDWAAARTQ